MLFQTWGALKILDLDRLILTGNFKFFFISCQGGKNLMFQLFTYSSFNCINSSIAHWLRVHLWIQCAWVWFSPGSNSFNVIWQFSLKSLIKVSWFSLKKLKSPLEMSFPEFPCSYKAVHNGSPVFFQSL